MSEHAPESVTCVCGADVDETTWGACAFPCFRCPSCGRGGHLVALEDKTIRDGPMFGGVKA